MASGGHQFYLEVSLLIDQPWSSQCPKPRQIWVAQMKLHNWIRTKWPQAEHICYDFVLEQLGGRCDTANLSFSSCIDTLGTHRGRNRKYKGRSTIVNNHAGFFAFLANDFSELLSPGRQNWPRLTGRSVVVIFLGLVRWIWLCLHIFYWDCIKIWQIKWHKFLPPQPQEIVAVHMKQTSGLGRELSG